MKNKDRDFAHYMGNKHLDGVIDNFIIKTFLDMCIEKRRLVAAYKTLKRIKDDYTGRFAYTKHTADYNPFNDDYTKQMGYSYMFNLKPYTKVTHDSLNIKGISDYEYCLAKIDEDYLNHKIHTVSEELAFLNMNIKKIGPLFRAWKESNGIKKVDMSTTTDLEFSGTLDASTSMTLNNLSKEEVEGIKKFITRLDKAGCSYIDNCCLTDKKTGLVWKYK